MICALTKTEAKLQLDFSYQVRRHRTMGSHARNVGNIQGPPIGIMTTDNPINIRWTHLETDEMSSSYIIQL